MAQFLLIHGACHGAWCWRELLPLLNRKGHIADAIDLPAHGDDHTPIGDVTLGHYVDAIVAAIEAPVILVGHSLAGIAISAVAQRLPKKVSRLVYLAAWMPRDGQSAKDMRANAPCQNLLNAMVPAPDRLSTTFDPSMVRSLLYHDCSADLIEFANKNLCPEPTAPSNTPISLGTNYASVDRSYIRCMDDRAIPADYQIKTSQSLPKSDVYEMACAHSPFFAQPGKLADILFKIAEDQ